MIICGWQASWPSIKDSRGGRRRSQAPTAPPLSRVSAGYPGATISHLVHPVDIPDSPERKYVSNQRSRGHGSRKPGVNGGPAGGVWRQRSHSGPSFHRGPGAASGTPVSPTSGLQGHPAPRPQKATSDAITARVGRCEPGFGHPQGRVVEARGREAKEVRHRAEGTGRSRRRTVACTHEGHARTPPTIWRGQSGPVHSSLF